jgi:hypothetical protein
LEKRKSLCPFRQYDLIDVRRTVGKVIRTEIVTGAPLEGWTQYADLLLLACVAEADQTAARQHWDKAIQMWDGNGFLDAAAKHSQKYATYKLGLALIAAHHLSPSVKPPEGLLTKLLSLQSTTAAGSPITMRPAAKSAWLTWRRPASRSSASRRSPDNDSTKTADEFVSPSHQICHTPGVINSRR